MNDQHPTAEANRQYGELFYSADAVAHILRYVASKLEGNERSTVLRLSHDIPTTMRWNDRGGDLQQPSSEPALYRPIQLRFRLDDLSPPNTIRLDALLRRGPSPVREDDGEHPAGVAHGQSDAAA